MDSHISTADDNIVIKTEGYEAPNHPTEQATRTDDSVAEFTSSDALEPRTYYHLQPAARLQETATSFMPSSTADDAHYCIKNSPGQRSGHVAEGTSLVTKDRPKRTKRRVHGNRVCGVCGDHAIAHNFGALTCETCKAFFRRNANRIQEISPCSFNKKCIINKTTRRFCPSCRIQKCFAIGMDPHLILDEEEKQAMRARRKRKQKSNEQACVQVDSSTHTTFSPSQSADTTEQHHSSPSGPSVTEDAEHSSAFSAVLPNSTVNAGIFNDDSFPCATVKAERGKAKTQNNSSPCASSDQPRTTTSTTAQAISPEQSSLPSLRCRLLAQGQNFRHVDRDQLPWDIKQYWLLSSEERSLLTMLTNSFSNIQSSLQPPLPSDNFHPRQPLSVDNLMFILEASLKKGVRFAKTIPDFRHLLEGDQIAILKGCALGTCILRFATLYIVERSSWNTYLGDVHRRDVEKMVQDENLFESLVEYCSSMKCVAKANGTIYALLNCIMLFDVRYVNLEEQSKVNTLKDKYIVLLKHYLESEFSYQHAHRYFVELMAQLEDAQSVHQISISVLKKFSTFFRPLVAEFFQH